MGEGLAGTPGSVSVVIVAYRSGPELARCLRALRENAPDAEVIVVDNGGADPGEERWAGLRIVEAENNLGFAGGANLGAAQANGHLLVFLNQDTVAAPGALAQLSRTAAEPGVGVVSPRLRLLDKPELLNSGGTVLHVSGIAWAGRYGEPAESLRAVEDVAGPTGAALTIRRELFQELGGFTAELFMYLEDLELGWNARLRGLRVVVDPGADVYHDYEFSRNADKLALLERNRLVFVLSAYSPRLLVLLAPLLAGVELAMVALALRQGWLRGKLGGWWWCMRRAPWLVRHRRETQRLRLVRDRELARLLTPVLDPKMLPLPRGTGTANRVFSAYWSLVRKAL